MDGLTKKTFTTSRNYTYAYHYWQPSASIPPKPTLLLCHGWPDHAELYAGILPCLLDLGHPIIVPDCLGYGGTSKPTDYHAYSLKAMANDMHELLDQEGVETLIPVGHDWGSTLAQRIYLFRPSKCAGLILLSVAYMLPQTKPFNLEEANKATEREYGYPSLAYWDLFAADDGPALLHAHVETLFHLLHLDHPDAMKLFFATHGNTRSLLTKTVPSDWPLKPYARAPGFKEAFIARMQRDGFEGPQCWYKAQARNVNFEVEREFPGEERGIKVPCLYVSGTGDVVCRTDGMDGDVVRGLVPDVTKVVLEGAGHWIPFERAEEVGKAMSEWLGKRF